MSLESEVNTKIPRDFKRYLEEGELLRDVKEILDKMVVGEDKNKLLVYLLTLQGQSIIVKGDSSTGKNTLVDSVLKLFPPDEILDVTSVTAKSLRWLERSEIGILYIKEVPHDALGDSFTPFALDLKQVISDRVLKPLYVETGNFNTPRTVRRVIRIHSVIQTTLEYELPEDIENRVWILSTDSSVEQTRQVCLYKAKLRENPELAKIDEDLLERVRTATEFLFHHRWPIRIPKATVIAEKIVQVCPFPRVRRDIDKIFDLIEAVARVHGRTVATVDDVKLAFELVEDVLGYMFRHIDPRLQHAFDVFREIEEKEAFVTASDLAKELGVSQTRARRIIRAMLEAGLIEEAGRGERGVKLYKSFAEPAKLDISKEIIEELLKEESG